MKRMLLALVMVLAMAGMVGAAPFLICDPQAGVTYYSITGDPYWTASVPAQGDGSLRTDLATIPVGAHTIQVVACNIWGCSTPSPFTFSKSVPALPVNTRVAP
jgi:hypothetical protein